ncbi:hypothetical protein [Desulfosporosinus sp. FKB]|uniref:hypothetical protein n=1 Tax=Desulfosporosinus sp. FKB TaxID=1969835 RepID=UPI000B49B544|nr:hypothetical protein [Desulfosporosinus sp. FKB]
MLQVKLYQFDNLKMSKQSFETEFLNDTLYYFENLNNVVGIGFDFNQNELKYVTEKAYKVGLNPIILTVPKFLKLLENALVSSRKITKIEFTMEIDVDDKNELEGLMISGQQSLLITVKDIIQNNYTFIKNVSWYETAGENPVELSLWDSGILYVNNGVETLQKSDDLLSYAVG